MASRLFFIDCAQFKTTLKRLLKASGKRDDVGQEGSLRYIATKKFGLEFPKSVAASDIVCELVGRVLQLSSLGENALLDIAKAVTSVICNF